jgi:uncharacterized coiled-coil DUF342 family protein
MSDNRSIHQTIADGIRQKLALQYAPDDEKASIKTIVAEVDSIRKAAEAAPVLKANEYDEERAKCEAQAFEYQQQLDSLVLTNENKAVQLSLQTSIRLLEARAARFARVVAIYDS